MRNILVRELDYTLYCIYLIFTNGIFDSIGKNKDVVRAYVREDSHWLV